MPYIDCCDWEQCKVCGECLVRCKHMHLSEEEAKAEKQRLLDGREPRYIYDRCKLCMSCDQFCPEDLMPFELILQRVADRHDRSTRKVPTMLEYMLERSREPGFFLDLYKSLDTDEGKIIDRWREIPPPAGETIYPGCFGRLFCSDIDNSEVLAGIPVYSPDGVCCGEWHYRTGYWNLYEKMADKFVAHFSRLKTERLICLCSSCYSFVGHILPDVYGKATGKDTLPFEVISFNDWLLERYEAGELEVRNPLDYKVAVHDSCHARRMGPDFYENMRKLLRIAGADLMELEDNREEGACCGAAVMAMDYRRVPLLWNYIKGMGSKLFEARKSQVSEMAMHCEGCYLPMMLSSWAAGVKLHYTREELLRAFGDEITKPISAVMPTILKTFLLRRASLAFTNVDPRAFDVV